MSFSLVRFQSSEHRTPNPKGGGARGGGGVGGWPIGLKTFSPIVL